MEDPRSVWMSGSSAERVNVLRAVRLADPAGARDLLISTWKDDTADDRTTFISVLEEGLGDADEPLLESSLDDRSENVRAAAAELLSRLPNSALVRRMIERVSSLLGFTPPKKRLLRKVAPAGLEIRLPPEKFDASWARDGVTEKPAEKIGQRQWWLIQFLAGIPPTNWSTAWELTPSACMEVPTGEFADSIFAGWRRATLRHPDPAWVVALLTAAAHDGRPTFAGELIAKAPQADADRMLAEILRSSHITPDQALAALAATRFELSEQAGRALCQRIDQHDSLTQGYAFVASALQIASMRLPVSFLDELYTRWDDAKTEYLKKQRDEFFNTMSIRRAMQREFLT